jgi:hypothetical protein
MQYTEKYNSTVKLLKELNNNQIEKNKLIYKKCECVNGNFNFIDYIKQSDFCKNIFENYEFLTINDFRDNIVEKISDDFVKYVINKGFPCMDREKKDIKNSIIGLQGELFNILYLEKYSIYTDPITGIAKRFNCVLPYDIVMQQKDYGVDLVCLNQNDEICFIQVKFYSTWSMNQGHKIELKEHCEGLMLELWRNFDTSFNYCNPDHLFFTFLGDKKKDITVSFQDSPYKNCITFIDKNDYYRALAGNTTVFKDFYKFLLSIN